MIQRNFIPGSSWLYFKIYTGHKTADDILVGRILPFVDEILTLNAIDKFFFIRFDDPDFHLRLRVHVPDIQGYAVVFNQFHRYMQPCVDDGRVAKILCDTYKREIERYGDFTMGLLEELFWIDSQSIIFLLSNITTVTTDNKEELRWHISLNLLDDTLSAFGVNCDESHKLMERMSENFKREFGFTNHTFTKQLNDKFRIFRKSIEKSISEPDYNQIIRDALIDRKIKIAEIANQIKKRLPMNKIGPHIEDLLPSILHMTMNRWFRSKNRKHELVIYDFLNKHYASKLARM